MTEYPRLRSVENKIETAVLAADKHLRKFLASSDIADINDALARHDKDEPYLKDAMSALTNHRLDLEDAVVRSIGDELRHQRVLPGARLARITGVGRGRLSEGVTRHSLAKFYM